MDLREFITNSRTQLSLLSSSPAMEFALLCLLWLSSAPVHLSFALGLINSLPFSPIYDLLLPFAVLFLAFRVWGGLCEVLADSRTGFCSRCSPEAQSCDGSGTGFRSHGVSCYASEKKMKSWNGVRRDDGRTVEREEGLFDVMKLRKELVKEREVRAWTEMELEKERRAASSAADEAMAKILLLSNEKGLVEREARMYREMAERKQAYDREVIDNWKWIISRLQEENLEDD